jgi:subtilisin family serine protease
MVRRPRQTLRPPSVTNPRAERDKTHGGFGGRSGPKCSRASFFALRPLTSYPQNVAGRDRSNPQREPPPRRDRRLPFLVGVGSALIMFAPAAAASARADICLIVDPVLSVGCADDGGSRPAASSAPPGAADDTIPTSSTSPELDPERIAVTVNRGVRRRAVDAAFARAGVHIEEAIPPLRSYLVRVAAQRQAQAVALLRSSPIVSRARPDVVSHALDTTPNDSQWPEQEGLRVIGLPRAWDTSRGSTHVVVAVVDTGIDPGQPDLRGALVPGINLVDPAAAPLDDHGHGTAVAGIVAARSDNGQGMAGVCWFCAVMPVKVLDGSGSGDDTRIAAGIVWAVDHGARVVNLSLGGPGSSPQLAAALAYAAAHGTLTVAAAGNSGTTVPFYPAADPTALSVAATTTADRAYPWSNFGPWVDVAAPGCNVAPARRGGYGPFCGTSSATPIVAGLAALALAQHPSTSPAQLRGAIEQAATPVPGVVQFGRVSAPQTLAALGAAGRRARLIPSTSRPGRGRPP